MPEGPLAGIRILELAAIGPVPFGVMLLADLGATVTRVDRVSSITAPSTEEVSMRGLSRGRRSIAVDLKHAEGRAVVLGLAAASDVFVEGFRPGVAERLGIGPEECSARNAALIYARVTGWGQDGPLAQTVGHDIDYLAVAGALHPIGRADGPPPPPLNLIADFGGGGLYLALGVLAALVQRQRSGLGQVVDVAMVDGVASLTTFLHGLMSLDGWTAQRQANLLDGGRPWYDTYATADGHAMAVGAIEPQFCAALLATLDLPAADWPQHDPATWPSLRQELTRIFATRSRDEWERTFVGTDACVAPVLALDEAPRHPHLVARRTFVDVGGATLPAPAPRLSRTPGAAGAPAPGIGQHTDEVLAELGLDAHRITALRAVDAVG